jgi:hypothetical protein
MEKVIPVPFKARAGQRAFREDVKNHRVAGFVTRRQYGKTTFAALMSLDWMLNMVGISIIFASVKLTLGREIVRAESAVIRKSFIYISQVAAAAKMQLQLVDSEKAKALPEITPDDFAELFEAQRLEFRLWHDNTTYSRTKIIALTPEGVGETGHLITDEVGRCKSFREVVEAVEWIISSRPDLRWLLTTTPPPDDTHYSFEMLAPPVGAEFPVNPEGNTYVTDHKVFVRSVNAWDAAADGVLLYDNDTGEPVTPEQSRKAANDKDAWDRNAGCKFVFGGTSACGLTVLNTAQTRGMGQCRFFNVTSDYEFQQALLWIAARLGKGRVGAGFDVATTTKGTSNPSSFSIVEEAGADKIVRAILNWKTWNPAVAEERIELLLRLIAARKEGGGARRLCVDATNEKYWSQGLRRKLAGIVPVELIVASETIERPGEPEPITMKQYLGSLLVGELDDNHLWIPSERYVREDWRLVRKEKGQFICEPDSEGKHGDTFDGAKLGLYALVGTFADPGEMHIIEGHGNSQWGRAMDSRRERSLVG